MDATEPYRLDFSEKPAKKTQATRLTQEQINAKKGFRLAGTQRAYLVLEIVSTNKTDVAIARKFGISKQCVNATRRRILKEIRSCAAKILYRKDGSLFFG